MTLRQFEGEDVRIVTTSGKIFEGYVSDYVFPEDNVPEEIEGIIVDVPRKENPILFNVDEISAITVMKK